jgi:hypothetical protein
VPPPRLSQRPALQRCPAGSHPCHRYDGSTKESLAMRGHRPESVPNHQSISVCASPCACRNGSRQTMWLNHIFLPGDGKPLHVCSSRTVPSQSWSCRRARLTWVLPQNISILYQGTCLCLAGRSQCVTPVAAGTLAHIEPASDAFHILSQFLPLSFMREAHCAGFLLGRHQTDFDWVIDVIAAE